MLIQVPSKDARTDNLSARVKYAEKGQRVDRVTNATEVGTIGDEKLIAVDTRDANIKAIEELQSRQPGSNEIVSRTPIESFSYRVEVDEVQHVGQPVKGCVQIYASEAAEGQTFEISVNAPGATPPTAVLYHKGSGKVPLQQAGMTWKKAGKGEVTVSVTLKRKKE